MDARLRTAFCISLVLIARLAIAEEAIPALHWGFGGQGPTGSYFSSNVPMHPTMPPAIAVAGGFYSSAALTPDGRVWAWGSNDLGQLGDGTFTNRVDPAPVLDLDHVVAIAAGSYHVLALKDDGTVWAWGNNRDGELGDGTRTHRNLPVRVSGLTNVRDIAAGNQHSLALTQDGLVYAWGSQQYGQLGIGGTGGLYLLPVLLTTLANVVSIDALGAASMAVHADGSVWTWGRNRGGLGDGTIVDRWTPVCIGLTNAVDVAAGGDFGVALLADGTLATWGQNNHFQLGDGTSVDRFIPGIVPGLSSVTQIDAGFLHSVVLRQDGSVWVWGSNADWGQLGLGMPIGYATAVPLQVPSIRHAWEVAAGGSSSLALGYLVSDPADVVATITPDGPLAFCEGGSVTLIADGGATYLWSNGATTRSILVTTPGTYSVTAFASGASDASDAVVVTVNPPPVATITASGPTAFCVGGSVVLTASEGAGYLWSNGATGRAITVGTSGRYDVTVTSAEGCAATSPAVEVAVEPVPLISASAGSAMEGSILTLTGFATGMPAGGAATIDWGDASAAEAVVLGPDGVIATAHVYVEDGTYAARLLGTSQFGCGTESAVSVVVGNAPPVITALSATIVPTLVTDAIQAIATFDDPGLLDTHTAEWSWGDGTTTAGPATRGTIQEAHVYATPGVHTITLRIVDDEGAIATRSFEYVVTYDPNGGFVTGGGWINSLAGAYLTDPAAAGKASFGFVSKYQNGAGVPTGSTEFQFKAASINFKSTSYAWLVVSGARAQFKGTGTINGAGIYEFLVTAIDGQVNGGGGFDKFRIKIWNATTGVVYDNMRDSDDSSDPVTIIGGGSVVIHK